mmetsp:Transcript_41820/g.75105  ORF Transcript_41820/g.75105 Transcript_41820/m.75105 type:complete len:380 (-) Transcript_41820:27-1166(-)
MQVHGSKESFNLEAVLRKNILDSEYYRSISTYETWAEVIDEIYESVTSVEPWLTGNARGPSTAFCCMYKLFTLNLSRREIGDTLSHPDSPFIRAVGFLYLRYICNPNEIWQWVKDYVDDSEEFEPSPYGQSVTMGAFVRDILLKQFYFETIFPRIPIVVERAIKEELRKQGLPTEAVGNGGTGGPDRRGVDEPNKRPPSVKAALSVSQGQTAPNRRAARESTFRTSGVKGDRDRGGGDRRREEPDRKPPKPYQASSRDRDYKRDRDYDDRRGRSRENDRRDREYDRRDRDRRDHRDRDKERRDRDYDRRDRERERGRSYGRRERSRSRSRDRGGSGRRERGGSRDARDVFRDSAPRDTSDVFKDSAPVAPSLDDLRNRY